VGDGDTDEAGREQHAPGLAAYVRAAIVANASEHAG
jgi:hypothetical protein